MTSRRILIAHQQNGFASLCESWLEAEGYEAEIGTERGQALGLIEEEAFDLVLVSNSFPETGGLEFLRLLKRKGLLAPTIILSEQSILPIRVVSEAIKLDVVDVIEKPKQPEDLLESVRAAIKHYPAGGMHGDLGEFALSSLISIVCNEGRQASLQIWHNGRQATIFFDKGEIIHAALDDREGEEAIYEALTWHEGHFSMKTGDPAPKRTVHDSWTGVVLEGLRRIDEERFDQEQLGDMAPPAQPDQVSSSKSFEEPPAPVSRSPTFDLGDETQREIERRIGDLYGELLPRCVLLTNRSGRLLHLRGDIERSKALSLAALVAGRFSAAGEIAETVAREGEARQFRQSLEEGEKWVLAVIFDPQRTQMGLARQLTLRTAEELTELKVQAAEATEEELQETGDEMDDLFRQEVGDALEDLFA